jgi:hypothetical protein
MTVSENKHCSPELTHQDIGQMDGYVRLYEEQHRLEGDNPTIARHSQLT